VGVAENHNAYVQVLKRTGIACSFCNSFSLFEPQSSDVSFVFEEASARFCKSMSKQAETCKIFLLSSQNTSLSLSLCPMMLWALCLGCPQTNIIVARAHDYFLHCPRAAPSVGVVASFCV